MPESVIFSIKWRKYYQNRKKKSPFSAIEIGRHNYEHLVDLETWANSSGEPVPCACKMPLLYYPESLPLSLNIKRSHIMQKISAYDVTNKSYWEEKFNFKVPRKMPEFLPEFFSIGKICSWALREQVDLAQADFFILSRALRDFASVATLGRWGDWKYAVLYYKEKLFIDCLIPESERFWKKGIDEESYDSCCINPPIEKLRVEKDGRFLFEVDSFDISDADVGLENLQLCNYGTKFEDILRSGEMGDPHFNGVDKELRMAKSDRLISLGNHKILTATRISGQDPDGPIEDPENQIEIKTKYPQCEEEFAKYTSLKLWIHCALVGVHKLYCGFRKKNGKLLEVKKYSMDDLVEIGKNYWDPNEILTFLDTFLSWLKEKLNKDPVRNKMGERWLKDELNREEGATFTLSYSGNEGIKLEKGEHPELRKIICERYDQNQLVIKENISIPDDTADDSDVPDNWDDSD